jgi:DNA-binding MarR family transcriptional regulator
MPSQVPVARRASTAQLAVALREAIARVNRRLRQTRPVGDITVAQISALQSLDAAGALTPRELAEVERVAPPTLSRILARLEERGLVQRTPHPTDGRQVILAPSPAGRQMLGEYRRARDEWLARRLAGLAPADRDTVARAAEILTRLAREG